MRHTVEHIFDASPARLWEVFFFDDAFVAGLYDHLGLEIARRELQREGSGETLIVRRKLSLVLRRELSPLLRPLLRAPVRLVERGEFSAELRRFSVAVELPVAAARIDCGGEYTWEALPSGQTRRIWRGRCEARVPLIAARLEASLLAEVERALDRSYAYTRSYLRGRAALQASARA